jgi:hypothetical protein
MNPNRRDFLTQASLAAVCLAGGGPARLPDPKGGKTMQNRSQDGYTYRIAFGAWINDMRNDPLPLENWPAPQLDEETIASVTQAMDVQSRAGFEYLDAWGLFATYGWPPDITSALDKDRRAKLRRLFKAAKERRMKIMLGLGLMTWGYDRIIEENPGVRGVDSAGKPHPHAMCGSREESWKYIYRILDLALGEFDFGGVHLESCDLGWCDCPECAGKDGVTGYGCRLNTRCADYIAKRWSDKIITTIPINWLSRASARENRAYFNPGEQAQIIELSRHIHCFMDQGWTGPMIDPKERRDFIERLHCVYGTSGGLWLYPDTRWDRTSYFLPYPQRSAAAIKEYYADGVRGCMIYQGPTANPAQELMMAFNGRMVSHVNRNPDEVLAEVIETCYRPKDPEALKKLAEVFQRAEDAYFGQWSAKRFADLWGFRNGAMPGEFKIDQHLFGVTPGPATYLTEPSLDDAGREEYKKGLVAILRELEKLRDRFDDKGRLPRIRCSLIVTLELLNTIQYLKGKYNPSA